MSHDESKAVNLRRQATTFARAMRARLTTSSLSTSTGAVLLALTMVVVFYQLRHVVWRAVSDGQHVLVVYFLLFMLCMAGSPISYRELPGYYSRLLRIVCIAVLGYLLLDPVDLTLVNPEQAELARLITVGYWIAVACAALSIRYPSFVIWPAYYLYLAHSVSVLISGYTTHRLASVTLVEMAQFLGFSMLCITLFSSAYVKRHCRLIASIDWSLLFSCLFFIAIGLHYSHYFWSGIQKLRIGEHPWSWALLNQTQNLMLSSLARGVLPSEGFPQVTQWLFDMSSRFVQPLNSVSLVVQLLAILAILRVGWIRISTVFYDALHVGIYLLSGLFLWTWVANNVAILIALKDTHGLRTGWPVRFCCVVTITLGGFSHFGNASRFAWWDLRDITTVVIQARTADGPWVDVPLTYFNSHAQVASTYVAYVQLQGHYPPSNWGANRLWDQSAALGLCHPPGNDRVVESLGDREIRLDLATRFVKSHHLKLLAREQRFGSAHPVPSLRYQHSRQTLPQGILSVESIKEYRILAQSVCLGLNAGELTRRVAAEDAVVIEL